MPHVLAWQGHQEFRLRRVFVLTKICRAKHEIITSEIFSVWLSSPFKTHLQQALRRPKALSEDTLADERVLLIFFSARVKFGENAYGFIIHVERG